MLGVRERCKVWVRPKEKGVEVSLQPKAAQTLKHKSLSLARDVDNTDSQASKHWPK